MQLVGRDEAVVFSKEMAGQHALRGQRQRADTTPHPLRPHLHLSTDIKSKKGTLPTVRYYILICKKGNQRKFLSGKLLIFASICKMLADANINKRSFQYTFRYFII